MYRTTGVYCWFNKVNGKRYVGSTTRSLLKRKGEYLRELARGSCHNSHLQRSWDKFGRDNFSWVILEFCPPEMCVARETWWIANYDSADQRFGYNICRTGRNHLGTKLTDEHKRKIGEANSVASLGKVHSEATKIKMSLSHKGRKATSETKARIAEAARRKWADPDMRKKMIAGMKAKRRSK